MVLKSYKIYESHQNKKGYMGDFDFSEIQRLTELDKSIFFVT